MTFYAQSSLVMPVQASHHALHSDHGNTMASSGIHSSNNSNSKSKIEKNNNVASSHSGMSSLEDFSQDASDVSKNSSDSTPYSTQQEDDSSKIPSSWDPQDDILLRHLKEIKKLGWKDIAQYFKNRTPNACQFRWRRLKSGALKHKSVASTMELTDHQLENVIIPDLPESNGAVSTTNTSSYNVPENDLKKHSRVRKSRASSMISSSTPRIDESMKTNDRTHLQKAQQQNNEHQPVVAPQKGFFSTSTAPAKDMNGKFNAMSQVTNGFAKPRTYSSSNTASNFSKNPIYYEQNQQAYLGFQSADMNNHVQQQNNGIHGNAPTNGIYTSTHTSQLPLPSQSQHAVSKNDEKIGFIPKVVVRSRRGSSVSNVNSSSSGTTGMLAHGNGFYHADSYSSAPAMKNSFSVSSGFPTNINPATTNAPQSYVSSSSSSSSSSSNPNTGSNTFSTPKSRKNSFSSRSRASSFHTGPNERRLSVLLTEKELCIDEKKLENKSRRSSVSVLNRRRGSFIKPHQPSSHLPSQQMHLSSSISSNNASNTSSGHGHHAVPWSCEEDRILLNSSLQKDEISILLGNRSDLEIQKRVGELQHIGSAQQKRKQGHQSSCFEDAPRHVNEELAISDSTSSSSKNVTPSPPIFSEQDREGGVSSVVSSTHSTSTHSTSNHTNQSRFSPPYPQASGSFNNRPSMASNMITPTTSGSGQRLKQRDGRLDAQRVHLNATFPTQTHNVKPTSNAQSASHFGATKNGNSPKDSDEDAILDDESEEAASSMNTNPASFNQQQQQQQSHPQYQPQQSNSGMYNHFQQHHAEHHQPQQSLPSLNSILRDMM